VSDTPMGPGNGPDEEAAGAVVERESVVVSPGDVGEVPGELLQTDGVPGPVEQLPGATDGDGPLPPVASLTDDEIAERERALEASLAAAASPVRTAPPPGGESPVTEEQAALLMASAEERAATKSYHPAEIAASLEASPDYPSRFGHLDLEGIEAQVEELLLKRRCPRCERFLEPCSEPCYLRGGALRTRGPDGEPREVPFGEFLADWRKIRDEAAERRGGALFEVEHGSVTVADDQHLRGPRVGTESGVGAVILAAPAWATELARRGFGRRRR